MAAANGFTELLSNLLRQIACAPDAPHTIQPDQWPAGSEERRLLEGLQAALIAVQHEGRSSPPADEEEEQRFQSIFEAAIDGLIVSDAGTSRVTAANPAACTMYGLPRPDLIGQQFTTLVHPDHAHRYDDYVQAVLSEGSSTGLQVHLRQDGSPFHVELSGSVYTEQGRPVLLCIVRDISQRVDMERLLQHQVEERTREQSTLLEISQTLASALELQPGLILDQLRVIIDYTHAGLFSLVDSSLAALAVRGPEALERALPFQIRLQSPDILTDLFKQRQSIRIRDVHSSHPSAQFLRSLLSEQAAQLLEGVQSWMWVPLASKDRMIGAIGVAHAERDYFTAHHADLALIVANQAAITMVNAELYENAHALAAMQERQRLARNLHDAVNQSLFSAGLIAEVLPRLWEQNPEDGRQSLEDLRRLTRGAQADMRLLLAELRPSTLTDADLGDLLRLLGAALAGRTNIPIGVTIIGKGTLPAEVQVGLYRLCQEGLTNIAKHAGASQVDIQVEYEPGAVELHLRDDGRGFDPSHTPPGHYGLSMMRERASAIGAALSITSQPGQGTEIIIRWVESQEQKAEVR
jgi:PAS domain S-box-containing protein